MSETVSHLDVALSNSDFKSEMIIINDGSTDSIDVTIRKIIKKTKTPIKYISQENSGRYLARKAGVDASKFDNILFVDSRVYVGKDSLRFLCEQLKSNNKHQVWNGHVFIDKKGSIFTRFWDAIVCIAWRKYFKNPKTTSYGIEDFDYYPKGTGFFFVPKKYLLESMDNFEKTTNDIRNSSDDTLLIRFINNKHRIHISPQFNCLYHGRTSFKGFMKHAYHRGEFFIDGFLRPGTRFFIPLIIVLLASLFVLPLLFIYPINMLLGVLLFAVVFCVALLVGALIMGVEVFDALSLATLGVPFALVYLCGLWRGVLRKIQK